MKPNLIRILAPVVLFAGMIATLDAQFRPPDRSEGRSGGRYGDRSSGDRSRFGSGGGAERFFGYMDRNRDGRLDEEEVRRMPSPFRDSLERQGVRLDRGISRDQFVREMPRAMEEIRRQRESERGSSDDERRRQDDERRREAYRQRQEQQRRDDSRRSSQPRTEFYTPRKSEPLTVDLPSRFEDGDTDQDGQIGYYEWRKWKPEAKAEFKLRDQNDDGFLTPRELLRPLPAVLESTEVAATSSTGSGTPGAPGAANSSSNGDRGARSFRGRGNRSGFRGPGGPGSTSTSTSSGDGSSSAADNKLAPRAKFMFNLTDSDKDGQISKEEWDKSRLIKPKFQEAGIDMTQPMNESQFVTAYLKAFGS